MTKLVKLDIFGGDEVAGVYRLLVDDSHAIRYAAAELVADSLSDQGARYLAQVNPITTSKDLDSTTATSLEQCSCFVGDLFGWIHG